MSARSLPCFALVTLSLLATACAAAPARGAATPEASSDPRVYEHDIDLDARWSGDLRALPPIDLTVHVDDGALHLTKMSFTAAPGTARYLGIDGQTETVQGVEEVHFWAQAVEIRGKDEVVIVPLERFIDARGPTNTKK